MYIGKVKRPDFETGDKKVTLTATVSKGTVTKTISFDTIVKKLGITDGQSVIRDLAWLQLPTETKTNIELPLAGPNNTVISWSSDKVSTITNTGMVTRPNVGESDEVVELTATVTKGDDSQTKTFQITVKAWTTEDELADASALINWELIAGTNTSINMVISDLVFPAKLGRDVDVSWSTSNADFCNESGKVTRPTYTQGPVVISIAATLTKNGETSTAVITGIRLEPASITNGEIALDAINKLTEASFLGSNPSLSQITSSMVLPISISGLLSDACAYSWSVVSENDEPLVSSYITLQPKVSQVDCTIVRPTRSEGNYICYLKATATSNDSAAGSTGTAYKRFRIVILAETD